MEDHNFTISGYKFIVNLSTRLYAKFLNVDQFAEWGIQMQHNSGIQIQISKTPCVDNTKMKFWQTNKNILENESNMTAQLCPLRYLSLYIITIFIERRRILSRKCQSLQLMIQD